MKNRLLSSSSPLLFIPALCALNLLPATAAGETTVYRCGPQGAVYTQQPCDGGRALAVDDHRTDAQQRAARQGIERDQALADRLRRERREQEAEWAAAPKAAAAIRGVPQQQDSASTLSRWQQQPAAKPGKRAGKKQKQKPAQDTGRGRG